MRAIVLTAPRKIETVDTWPEPDPGPEDVVVAVRAVGLCGSDLGVHDGTRPTTSLPWVMGHEGGGEIVAIGTAVTDRRVGQRVVVEPNYCCRDCPSCRVGLTSGCDRRLSVGINVPGLLAERVAVPARFTWPLPEAAPDETLALLEPLAVARSAVRRSGVRAGDECLVVGAGSQGLLVCLSLQEAGASVRVTDPHRGRTALAESLGARRADLTASRRYPFVFDTAGVPAAWQTSESAVATGGTVVMIGMSPEPVGLSSMELTRRQLHVRGSLIYDHPGDFAATVAALPVVGPTATRILEAGTPPEHAAAAFLGARSAPGKSWIDLSSWQEARDG